jgi:2-oxoglutarate ferredoxin oxidoreductase subunit gamma
MEFRLSGSGGQGLLLTGTLLGEAAAIYSGKNAVQTQSYGPEARGGASRSEVIISDEEIDYPKVRNPDVLLSMTQEALAKYGAKLRDDAVLIVDPHFVKELPSRTGPTYAIPLTKIAVEKAGKKITANVVALGAMAAITRIVSLDALRKAVLKRAPKGTEEMNTKALEEGFKAGTAALSEHACNN